MVFLHGVGIANISGAFYLQTQQRRQTLPFLTGMRDGADKKRSRHDSVWQEEELK